VKKWLIGISTIGLLSTSIPSVLAADGLQRPESATSIPADVLQSGGPEFNPGARQHMHHMEIKSSVQVSRDSIRDAYEASRDAYTKKLQKYAKCSKKDAEKAVSAAHPGMKISELQLRNIRTNLVYIAMTEDDQDKYLVVVDAGNGKVLMDRQVPTNHERAFADK
jgi:hypothetical protein